MRPLRPSPRVSVLSLNPAIDAEWRVYEILWEEKNVVHAQRRWAGGKGPNVARWLTFLGAKPELLIPLGGATGREMQAYLRQDRLRCRVVPFAGETRVNVVITEQSGRQMRFNQPGVRADAKDWQRILDAVRSACRNADALILSGSLPPGAPVSGYAQIIRIAHEAGRRVFLDCDGAALKAAVRSRPFLVKPNRHELAGWAGRDLTTLASVRDAALAMSRVTHGWVLVSLSGDGAMLVNAAEQFAARAFAHAVKVVNTLGAGDATLAAAAHAVLGKGPPLDWLRAAVTAGTAATQAAAGKMVSRRAYAQIATGIKSERS